MSVIDKELQKELAEIEAAGLYKRERIITTPQSAAIETTAGSEVLNFCANNYLGLSSESTVIQAAKDAIDSHGFGMSSVRFICGTQDIHKELESRIAKFVGTEDAILYAAAFDANGGLFEPILGKEDAIISDQLNHASIIDGIRLCKAQRYRYGNNDMADLEAKLKEADANGARRKLIATDGVFSMDGIIAQIDKICDLAEKYNALVMVDDCHATGFTGATGRGSAEHCDAYGRVDIITGTFGKALGGASRLVLISYQGLTRSFQSCSTMRHYHRNLQIDYSKRASTSLGSSIPSYRRARQGLERRYLRDILDHISKKQLLHSRKSVKNWV